MAVYQNLTITEIENSQNVSDNTSQVRILWTSQQTGTSYNETQRTAYYWISVNGGEETQSSVDYILPLQTTKTIVDVTITVPHNADGTGSVSVRTWMNTHISAGIVEKTASKTLQVIPRGATITSAPDFTDLDNPQIFYSNPAGDAVDLLHAFLYLPDKNFEISYREISKTGNSYVFSLTDDERSGLRNATTGNPPVTDVVFCIRTVIGDNSFYAEEKKTFHIMETEETRPVIDSITVIPINGTLPNNFEDLFISGKSKAQIGVATTTKYGATVENVTFVVDGKTYNGSTVETSVLMQSGQLTISASVKDSRGFTAISTANISVIPYSAPTITSPQGETSVKCYRATENGTPNDNSEKIYIKAAMIYSPVLYDGVQKNLCAMRWRYKLASQEWSNQSWYSLIERNIDQVNTFDNFVEQQLSETSAWTIQIGVVDDIGESQAISFDIFTESVDFHLGGNCIGIGTYGDPTRPFSVTIDERWKLYFDGKTASQIILDISHPVGSFLYTENATDPGSTIGGTWELINSDTEYVWKRTE